MSVHRGEIQARTLAGIEAPDRIGASLSATIPSVAAEFVSEQTLVFIAVAGQAGYPWGTVLAGEPGFLEAIDGTRLAVRALPHPGDPVAGSMVEGARIGMTVIEFESRKRMRVNGIVASVTEVMFVVTTDQVYANCPKYIQSRRPAANSGAMPRPLELPWRGSGLRQDDIDTIARADTVFLGTGSASLGADMSHRGGMPGFVTVAPGWPATADRLVMPDYRGNRFFNSFGNLELDPHASLLFVDFASGSALHLGGRGTVDWSADVAESPGAQRLLHFEVAEVISRPGALPTGWTFLGYSEANPA